MKSKVSPQTRPIRRRKTPNFLAKIGTRAQPSRFRALCYISAMTVIVLSSSATVLGANPFGTGLYISLVLSGLNPLALAPALLLGGLLFSASWQTVLGVAFVVLLQTVLKILTRPKPAPSTTHKKNPFRLPQTQSTDHAGPTKKLASVRKIAEFSLASQTKNPAQKNKRTVEIICLLTSPLSVIGFIPALQADLAALLLFVFFVPVFVFVGHSFFAPILARGAKFRLLDYEMICGGVVLSVLAFGLFRLEIYHFPPVMLAAALAILLAAKVHGLSGALVTGLCFGFGCAAADYQIIWLAYFPVMALLAAIFTTTPRPISGVALLIGYVLVTYFFGISQPHAYLQLAALAVGAAVYALIPRRRLAAIKAALCPTANPAAARHNIGLLQEKACAAVRKTGEIFEEMSRYIKEESTAPLPLAPLTARIRSEICTDCNKKCAVKDNQIRQLIEVSVQKGRATIVDLPAEIIETCKFSAAMIAATARIADEYHQKQTAKNTLKLAKNIVSEQLLMVGDVLTKISDSLTPDAGFDFAAENKLTEELTYHGIFCQDAVIADSGITLVLDKPYPGADIEAVLKKTLKNPYVVQKQTQDGVGTVVFAAAMPMYDVVFSVVSQGKGEISGDTHSFIKIGSNRFLMSLCDGMGSGAQAERFAAGAIGLIECFYQAGFDHASVIKCVNRFLSLSGDEAFTAADICVVDLASGVADIFKIGSPACYIKSEQSVRQIDGSSLPIGAMDEIRPSFSQNGLCAGDMVVLVSDGVADCFDGETLAAEISSASDISPKDLCQQILSAAKSKTKKIKDDMTVTALRIFENH